MVESVFYQQESSCDFRTLHRSNSKCRRLFCYIVENYALPNCHVGFPQRVWLDKGTENSLIAQCQVAFTMCHKDEQQSSMSVQYGSSPANSVRQF